MIYIRDLKNYNLITTKKIIFGGGEQHVQLLDPAPNAAIIELAYSQDSDIIELAMYTDALRIAGCKTIILYIPYFPGARQDRVCNVGEALSVKVYANLINAMKFDSVVVFDPHSDVTGALIDNVRIVNNHQFACDALVKIRERYSFICDVTLISPDAGSNKKIYDFAKIFKGPDSIPVIRADKLRDVQTGKIIDMQVYAEDLTGQVCVIVDDICAKGGTFCGLATKLLEKNARAVYLVVSHYEGTADPAALKEAGITQVYTTDSKPLSSPDPKMITRFNIQKYLTID